MPRQQQQQRSSSIPSRANFFHALVKNVNISCGLMRALRQSLPLPNRQSPVPATTACRALTRALFHTNCLIPT